MGDYSMEAVQAKWAETYTRDELDDPHPFGFTPKAGVYITFQFAVSEPWTRTDGIMRPSGMYQFSTPFATRAAGERSLALFGRMTRAHEVLGHTASGRPVGYSRAILWDTVTGAVIATRGDLDEAEAAAHVASVNRFRAARLGGASYDAAVSA